MFWIAIILLVNLNKFASLVETEKQGSQHSLHLFFQEIREQAFPRFWEPQTQRPHWKKEPYNLFKNRINTVLSVIWEAMGAFHLVKHSENSGSGLNHGKTFFRFPRLQNVDHPPRAHLTTLPPFWFHFRQLAPQNRRNLQQIKMEQLFPIEKFPEIHTEISGFFFLNGKRPMMSKLQRHLDPWPSLWRWFTNWAAKTCWGCIGNCDFIWTSESESNAFFTARITSSFDHNPSFGFLFRSYPHVKVTFVTQLRSIRAGRIWPELGLTVVRRSQAILHSLSDRLFVGLNSSVSQTKHFWSLLISFWLGE